jgi:hypothetical protein
MPTDISGAVAALLNERELAINIGREAGVIEGMRFKVLEKPKLILDPDSKAELGVVQREKVKIKVVEVHPKFSIARTYETYQTGGGVGYAYRIGLEHIAPIIGNSTPETRVRTLRNADRPSGFEEIDESQSYVEVGDPVQMIDVVEAVNRTSTPSAPPNQTRAAG